jgi:hypothetical protein
VSLCSSHGKGTAKTVYLSLEENAMSQNGNAVSVEPQVNAVEDNSHLLVELTEESYNVIQDVMRECPDGSKGHSMDWWIESLLRAGANAKLNTWRQRDKANDAIKAVELLKLAASGNVDAKKKLAKLFNITV